MAALMVWNHCAPTVTQPDLRLLDNARTALPAASAGDVSSAEGEVALAAQRGARAFEGSFLVDFRTSACCGSGGLKLV